MHKLSVTNVCGGVKIRLKIGCMNSTRDTKATNEEINYYIYALLYSHYTHMTD
jgi:hypothetical protein